MRPNKYIINKNKRQSHRIKAKERQKQCSLYHAPHHDQSIEDALSKAQKRDDEWKEELARTMEKGAQRGLFNAPRDHRHEEESRYRAHCRTIMESLPPEEWDFDPPPCDINWTFF